MGQGQADPSRPPAGNCCAGAGCSRSRCSSSLSTPRLALGPSIQSVGAPDPNLPAAAAVIGPRVDVWPHRQSPACKNASCSTCWTIPTSKTALGSFALSQMGIANAVAIARSNVPRAIAGLKDRTSYCGAAGARQGRFEKTQGRFLTDSGVTLASETWERLSDWPVRIILDDQPAVSSTLGGAKSVVPFEMRPVDIIRYIDEAQLPRCTKLVLNLVERDLSKHVEKQLVTSLADLPPSSFLRPSHGTGQHGELA